MLPSMSCFNAAASKSRSDAPGLTRMATLPNSVEIIVGSIRFGFGFVTVCLVMSFLAADRGRAFPGANGATHLSLPELFYSGAIRAIPSFCPLGSLADHWVAPTEMRQSLGGTDFHSSAFSNCDFRLLNRDVIWGVLLHTRPSRQFSFSSQVTRRIQKLHRRQVAILKTESAIAGYRIWDYESKFYFFRLR